MNSRDNQFTLYAVSTYKLILMSICTYGVYNLYWFYRNWDGLRKYKNDSYSPLLRAWLFPIFMFFCFKEIKKIAIENNVDVGWNEFFITILYFAFLSGWYIPYMFILGILPGLALVNVNLTCVAINRKQGMQDINEFSFNLKNYIILAVGGILVTTSLIRVYMYELGIQL
jgi:hypothetical protein